MINRYKLKISGKNPKYFIKTLIQEKILFYNLESTKDNIKITVSYEDYLKIKEIKTTYKIEIINRYGKSKLKYLFDKYLFFIMSLLFGIIIIYLLSNIIFKVEVIHSSKYIRNLVKNDLEDLGIKKYRFKVSFEKQEEIVRKILEKEKDNIEWLEIENIGTSYTVKVEQRKKNKEEKECKKRNIVARKDAMILQIDALEGEVVKKKYDYVKKGDVIISGLIYNKETIVSKRCATGNVYGEVWYKVTVDVPINYKEVTTTGKSKYKLEVSLFNNNYTLFNKYKTYKRKKISLIKSNILPIEINLTNYLETKEKKEFYTLKNVGNKALKLAEEKLKTTLTENDSVISKNVLKKVRKKSRIEVEVFFKVKEDITDTVSIENIDIDIENNKKEE